MEGVTPQNDAVFKMIFTDPKHERVLIRFLNSAIESKDLIKKVTILNSEIKKKHVQRKGSRLDILAETERGELVDVEMQIGVDLHMVGRTLFYWSQLFSGQLIVGERYDQLRRTISINILNFKLFKKDERFWRKCHLTDDQTHEKITDLLEIQFVELNKMGKLDKESPITFWIEFFKNPYSEICKELYKIVPELKEAKEIFEQVKADPKKRREIQEREDAIRNFASAVAIARDEGRDEERAEAAKRENELKEEALREKIESAESLINAGVSVEVVADSLGLPPEEIKKL